MVSAEDRLQDTLKHGRDLLHLSEEWWKITDGVTVASSFWNFVLRLMGMVSIKNGKDYCAKDSGTPKPFYPHLLV